MTRPRHLTPGWCWRADIDGDPSVWGIYGHVDDAEAVAIVEAYEGEPLSSVDPMRIFRDHRRNVPCRRPSCMCDGGSHLELAEPGHGASPYTWVELDA